MYLINIQTLELEDFIEGQIPSYAILSHRWGPEEPNFKEVFKNRANKAGRGYRKIAEASRVAAGFNVEYIWIDTCCIDRKSSADLSEAINSMFSWYEKAKVCIAYLEDINCARSSPLFDTSFQNSVWFTRSWTLQELLAPHEVYFFNTRWTNIGTRGTLANQISRSTNIPRSALEVKANLREFPSAQKMTWASRRKATRTEDIAYSLLGIFEVHMPLLYGEGVKAYERLQEEVMRRTTEPSLLLWRLGANGSPTNHNLLADSPAWFSESLEGHSLHFLRRFASTLTNIGLKIELQLVRMNLHEYAGIIAWTKTGCDAIMLRRLDVTGVLYRIGIRTFNSEEIRPHIKGFRAARREVTILRSLSASGHRPGEVMNHVYGFEIRVSESLPVRTLIPRKADDTSPRWVTKEADENAEWVVIDHPLVAQCLFKQQTLPAMASFECKFSLEQSLPTTRLERQSSHLMETLTTLYIDMCFDFDFRPCIQIRHDAHLISNSRSHAASTLEQPFGAVEWETRFLDRYSQASYDMATISDQITGGTAYVYRIPGSKTMRFPLPALFAPSKNFEVWLRLVPPSKLLTPSTPGWWSLIISDEPHKGYDASK